MSPGLSARLPGLSTLDKMRLTLDILLEDLDVSGPFWDEELGFSSLLLLLVLLGQLQGVYGLIVIV